jgi:CRP-like cAMP-binding protein
MIINKTLHTELLHNFTPLNALPPQRLREVLVGSHIDSLESESIICRYGDCDDKAIFLLSGQVTLIDHQGQRTELNALDLAANYPLVDSKPRQFTVKAEKTVNVLVVNQTLLNDVLLWEQSLSSLAKMLFARVPPNTDKQWLLHLLQSHIFYRLPPMNILELLNSLTEINVTQGQRIIQVGDKADCCYFIKSGRAEVSQQIGGEQLVVAYLSKGSIFGEEGLLKDAPRNADITMLEDGVLMRLGKRDFDRLLKSPSLQSMSFTLALSQIQTQDAEWLDVRLLDEYQQNHLSGALHLALPDIRLKARQLPLNKNYIIYCDNGQRSAAAAFLLGVKGYNTTVLAGGLWSLTAAERAQYLESA